MSKASELINLLNEVSGKRIDKNSPSTMFDDKKKAEKLAKQNQKDDPDFTYKVVSKGKKFAIEVFDEDGKTMGFL